MKSKKQHPPLLSFITDFIDERILKEESALIAVARKQCQGKKRIADQCRAEIEKDKTSHIVTFTTRDGGLFAKVWISRESGTVQKVQHGLDCDSPSEAE